LPTQGRCVLWDVDATGNVYIADTNNQRIREVSNGSITTIAGDGEELYAGDGGPATSAALDSPTGVAVDASGTVYIADRLNQRIRIVSGGNITTLAGNSIAGFSGDGAAPAAAMLAKPSGVSVDAAGNVYIADTGNQRIREVGGGAIATIEGSGAQGFGGDAGPATSAVLNSPRAVAPDAFGNISIADQFNARVRSGSLPMLTFPSASARSGQPTAGRDLGECWLGIDYGFGDHTQRGLRCRSGRELPGIADRPVRRFELHAEY